MSEKKFFEQQTPSSRIKAGIVSEYFPRYCNIIARKYTPKSIRFIDLFAGPGLYEDGNASTPILIGRKCKKVEFLKNTVELIFNDKDKQYIQALENNFVNEFPDDTFTHKPIFVNKIVGQDERLRSFLLKNTHNGKNNNHPSVLFIDPFGYKGVETFVLAEFLKNWGNEIFLFFNIKRIHPALENNKFQDLMTDLFPTTLDKVKHDRRYRQNTPERISLIISCLQEEFENILKSKVYFTAFKFQEEDNDATSHYILHFTKGSRGFDLVKTIYNDFANVGTIFDGINTYTFDAKQLDNRIVPLFDLNSINIDRLKDDLYTHYKGKKITARSLFEEHHIATNYSRRHYTDALRRLRSEEKLNAEFTDDKKHIKTVLINDHCILKFN